MDQTLEVVTQMLWNADQAAAEQSPSLAWTVLLAALFLAGLLFLAGQAQKADKEQLLMAAGLVMALSLGALLLSPFTLGWIMLPTPLALATLCGFSSKAAVRWTCRVLFIGSALAALVIGGVLVAAVLVASMGGWLLGYVARKLLPASKAAKNVEASLIT